MSRTAAIKPSQGMSITRLINLLLILFIIFALIFGLLYYFVLSPQKILYSVIPVSAGKSKPPKFQFAFYGEGDHMMQKPMGLAIKGDKVFISDAGANKILVFDKDGRYKYSIGQPGTGAGDFNYPYGIAVDDNNRIIVADMKNHRVKVLDEQGKFLSYFPAGSGQGYFTAPGGVAVANRRVYITDIWKDKVLVFDLQGNKMLEFGSPGSGRGEFKYPNGVTADNKGNIYVADSGNNRVEVFDSKGRFLREIAGAEIEGVEARFSSPRGIAVLPDDMLFIVSYMGHSLWTTDTKGRLYYRFGEKGDENTQFDFPSGISVDKNKLYITDSENHGVKVYAY